MLATSRRVPRARNHRGRPARDDFCRVAAAERRQSARHRPRTSGGGAGDRRVARCASHIRPGEKDDNTRESSGLRRGRIGSSLRVVPPRAETGHHKVTPERVHEPPAPGSDVGHVSCDTKQRLATPVHPRLRAVHAFSSSSCPRDVVICSAIQHLTPTTCVRGACSSPNLVVPTMPFIQAVRMRSALWVAVIVLAGAASSVSAQQTPLRQHQEVANPGNENATPDVFIPAAVLFSPQAISQEALTRAVQPRLARRHATLAGIGVGALTGLAAFAIQGNGCWHRGESMCGLAIPIYVGAGAAAGGLIGFVVGSRSS